MISTTSMSLCLKKKKLKAIFIPGWATDQKIFTPFYDLFSKYELLNFYFFSSGTFPSIKRTFPLQEIKNTILIAYSMGGLYALKWASKYPFKALILISSFSQFSYTKIGDKLLQKLRKDFLSNPLLTLKNFYKNISSPFPVKGFFSIKKINQQNLLYGIDCLEKGKITDEELKKIDSPSFLVYGEKDLIISHHHFQKLKSTIKNPFSLVDKNSGHSLIIHRQDFLKEEIKKFISNII